MASFMKNLTLIARCAAQYRQEHFAEYGLTGWQYSFINNLCRNPGISQEQLARLLYLNKSNVTRNLATMEENGFVRREPSGQDKRTILVYPTEKARQLYPTIQKTLHDWSSYVTEDFSGEELDMLMSMMEKISQKAEQYVEGKEEK